MPHNKNEKRSKVIQNLNKVLKWSLKVPKHLGQPSLACTVEGYTRPSWYLLEAVPMPVIRDQLGHSSLAVTDRYLRNVAPAEVIAAMQRRQWAEPAAQVGKRAS